MPNFDGTGPMGQGIMTGRRRGRSCDTHTKQIENTENQTAIKNNIVYGLGRGGRPRGGAGLGNGFGGAVRKVRIGVEEVDLEEDNYLENKNV